MSSIGKIKYMYLNNAQHCRSVIYEFKKGYGSARRRKLYNTLAQFGMQMKLVGRLKIGLNGICSKFRLDKYLCDEFCIQKRGYISSPLTFNRAL
jgi:hypothetical protein